MSEEQKSPLVVITGGSGFLGTEVAIAALESGWRVHVIDPKKPGWNSILTAELKDRLKSEGKIPGWEEATLFDAEPLFDDTAAVIHLAADKGIFPGLFPGSGPFDILGTNTELVLKALDLHRRLPTWRSVPFIFASSAAVYTKTPENTPYGVSKQIGEMLVSTSGLPSFCNARIFNLHHPSAGDGVEAVMRRSASRGKPITVHGDGSQTRDFVPVEDAGRCIFELARLASEGAKLPAGIDICTGRETRIMSVAARVSEETGALVRLLPKAATGPKRSVGNPGPLRALLGLDKEVKQG